MNERTPRPFLSLVPPSGDNEPGTMSPDIRPTQPAPPETPFDLRAERERFPLPDYSQVSDKELRRAQNREELRLFRADFGHFFLRVLVISTQIYANLYHGENIPIDWFMDVSGIRPDLDEKERVATERIQALSDERRLRRSVRQQLHNR